MLNGWSIIYDTPAKRLLFLCGLKLIGNDWQIRFHQQR